jgi:CheY-like chemotaxis protein
MAPKKLILVVEDDAANLLFATTVLEEAGFAVEGFESAEAALKGIRRRSPDLILTDIELPGMDGLELTKKLKRDPATAEIPIVAMTGQTMPLHQRAAMAAGCAGFVSKPATPAELTAEVMAHVETPHSAGDHG